MASHLFPLVVVEDHRHEDEDGVTKEPQEAALWREDNLEVRRLSGSEAAGGAQSCYLSKAEVEVSLQGAPLCGDDLAEDGGQQEGQRHSQSQEEETC